VLRDAYRICERFGMRTPDDLRDLPDARIKELRAYVNLEPFGLTGAQICSVLAEINRNHDKRSEPFTAEDFMGYPRKEAEVDDGAEALFNRVPLR
jgi:hypothetical protein